MKKTFTIRLFLFFVLLSSSLFAQAGSYYDLISTSSPSFIKDLQSRIRSPYQQRTYDEYDETMVAQYASRDTSNGQRVVTCIYSGENYVYTKPFGWSRFSREHTWCYSWMPTNGDDTGPEYSDQHHLFPVNQVNANEKRSNHPLGIVDSAIYTYLEGRLGYNKQKQLVYEPRNSHKGDAARALLYMSLRYDGVRGNWTFNQLNNVKLPNLPDKEAPQDLNTLLEWNRLDPPDKWEVERNNYVQSIQLNRNPFVDHPEYVNYINFNDLSLLSPSFAAEPGNFPSNVTASAKDTSITIKWTKASDGTQAPTGYLVQIFEKNNYFIPVDGAVYSDDSNLNDGRGLFNVPASAGDSLVVCKVKPGTKYYFSIYPFNRPEQAGQINYKTGGTVPRDSVKTTGTAPTAVFFTSASAVANEGATYQLSVSISNPGTANPTTVEVALASGSSLYVGGFRSQTLTFPANSSAPQTLTLNLSENSAATGTQTIVLQLKNVTGGNFASIALPSNFTLSILDNDGTSQGGNEDFAGFPETSSSYNSGTFKGRDGSTWSYTLCSGNSAVVITAPSPVLKRDAALAKVTSGLIQGGCGTLSFKYMQAFSYNVKLGLYVNDNLITTVNSNGQTGVQLNSGDIKVNVEGTFTLKFQQIETNSGQVTIDDVKWTPYPTTGVDEGKLTIPETMYLGQSYPNPCNPEAVISYGLNENGHVSLKVYNTIGVEVASLVNGYQAAGEHSVKFSGGSLPSGIYFYRLEAGKYNMTKKLVLLK